jgi:hypothetical protein
MFVPDFALLLLFLLLLWSLLGLLTLRAPKESENSPADSANYPAPFKQSNHF